MSVVRDYKIMFYDGIKLIGSINIASGDSLQAEETGRMIAGKGITVEVERS